MFRPIAVLLSVLLVVHTPAQAGPVTLGDVMQIIGNYQNPPDLRIRGIGQTSESAKQGGTTSTDPGGIIDGSAVISHSDSLLSGVVVETNTTQDPVKVVIAEGEVDGTLCDCGFVTVASGMRMWPLVFLAAVPLFFIKDKDDCESCVEVIPTPTPTPTPTPQTPIPEPASLLLFGSGLAAVAASLRRRRLKAQLKQQGATTEEG